MISDPEVQKELARLGDANALDALQQGEAERVAVEFRQKHANYYVSDDNWRALVQWMAEKYLCWDDEPADEAQQELIERGFFTLPNLEAAFKALTRSGSLETDPLSPRRLSEHQRRSIALQASYGGVDDAISRYLRERLPEPVAASLAETFDLEQIYDLLADPEFKAVVEEACWFCWQNGRADFAPTKDRLNFMQSFLAGRIPTATLLDAAWKSCQEAEKDVLRSAVLRQVSEPNEVSEPDLDKLSDAEIDNLWHETMKHIAREVKRPRH
jgi:hypothetical protein